MAIQKTKILRNGETGNYWKITSFRVDKQGKRVTYTIDLFKNSSFSDIEGLKGNTKVFTYSATKEQLTENLIELGYTFIKNHSDADLENGEDV